MNIGDLIPGRDKAEEAKALVSTLERSKKIKPEQQKMLDEARAILKKRKLVRDMIAVIGIITAGTGIGYLMYDKKETDSTHQTAAAPETKESKPANSIEGNEEATDKIIEKAEQGAQNLEKVLKEKSVNTEPALKAMLLEPFLLMGINKENPGRNSEKFIRQLKANGTTGIYKQDNINFFGYEVAERPNYAASFSCAERIMELSPDFDPANLLDALVLHHELRHVMQDTKVRSEIASQDDFNKYVAFYTGKPGDAMKVPLLEEASAYLYEVEALNVILDGQLKTAALSGRQLDLETVRMKLKAKKDQSPTISMVIELANAYYNSVGGKMKGGAVSGDYMNALAKIYRRNFQNVRLFESADYRHPKLWK